MSMIKPAFPVVNPDAALSAHLVWAALMTDDGPNNVRNGGSDDLTFRDLVNPSSPVYRFYEPFSGTEGLVASPDRQDSGIITDSNTWARLEAALGGVNFEVPGATGGSETQHWMKVIRLRASGSGTIVHKGRSNVSTDLHAYVTSNTLAVAVGNQTLSMNTSGAPYTDGAPFVNGSQDMTLVIASQGATGRFKVTYTGHPQERLGPIGAAAAQLLDPSGDPFPVRLGARATLDDADNDTVADKHPDLTIYSVQVFRRATVFTQAELLSIANDTYQCFRERIQTKPKEQQARELLEFNRPMSFLGDSQSAEHVHRLPNGLKRWHIPVENVSSLCFTYYPDSSSYGQSPIVYTPTGATWPNVRAEPGTAGLPADLAGRIPSYYNRIDFTGNVANNQELLRLKLWNLNTLFVGDLIWSKDIAINMRGKFLYASSPTLPSAAGLTVKLRRNGENTYNFTPDHSTVGIKAIEGVFPNTTNNVDALVRLYSNNSGTDETGGELVYIGSYFYKTNGGTSRAPGWGLDVNAIGGWDCAEWQQFVDPIAIGEKWGHTVVPEYVHIMLGHNMNGSHTTQLSSGSMTGQYTDDMTSLVLWVQEAAAIARHMALDWSTETHIVIATPWEAAVASAFAGVLAETGEAVHQAIADANNMLHISLLKEFGYTSPIPGLHPGDAGGNGDDNTKTIADAWVTQLQGLLASVGMRTRPALGASPLRTRPMIGGV
jgi:hypothetical protein